MSNLNMNWQSDGFTVYALNERGVNDFSFHVQGNGRNGHDPKTLQKVVSMAKAAPDMYRALRELVSDVERAIHVEHGGTPWLKGKLAEIDYARAALAKADGE